MTKAAQRYETRLADTESRREALRAERDEAIRNAYREGMTLAQIGDVVDLTHQRVSNIVRRKG